MRIQYFAALTLLLLSACTGYAGDPQIAPTSTALPVAADTPTASPSETSAPVPDILAAFPLTKGARWEYAAEIEYQDPDNLQETLTWNGVITVSVVDQDNTPDGKIVFTLEEVLKPTPPQGVWRGFRSYQYTVAENEIFDEAQSVLQWPLEDGQTWKTWPDSDFVYQTEVVFQGDVETSSGSYQDCYQITVRTNPDVQGRTFCPGVGYVQHFYRHFGTPQDEYFELTSFEEGS